MHNGINFSLRLRNSNLSYQIFLFRFLRTREVILWWYSIKTLRPATLLEDVSVVGDSGIFCESF